ncbi:TPR-repeat protein [Haematococcus lacustris]|uniref:TPR-repeat protein n=1 Tax=Haematococcus lacustris TaxID=44745 RepID=A0A699Y8T1_HAELA|nr:TPR-repeat protein [Haematococcus lacustris]
MAVVLVDGKNFQAALGDFEAALQLTPEGELAAQARLLAGRALALEGLADWDAALRDYEQALQLAQQAGESPDPYVINSRGNCYNSLGRWQVSGGQ